MKSSRRTFAMALAVASTVSCVPSPGRAQTLLRAPYVGAVTDSSAVVAAWIVAGASVRLEYARDAAFTVAKRAVVTAPVPSSPDTMVMIPLAGLAPSTRYHYRIIAADGADTSAPRSFATFPREGVDAPVSFFFGSCQQSHRAEPGAIVDSGKVFDVAADLGGDLFVQMGDWAYPDVHFRDYPSSDSVVRASYLKRLDTTYPFPARVLAEMPIAYVWDDHDSFGDNSNGAFPAEMKTRVGRAYQAYVPHYALANPDAGIWQSFMIGNVEVFMLDSRSQRSPIDSALKGNQFVPPSGHSMLAGFPVTGIDQRRWLLDGLRSSRARWKVIVSPVPFNPAMAAGITAALFLQRRDIARSFAEYWAGYPADIDSLVSLLRSPYGRNILIVSGSAHTNMYDDGTHSVAPEFVAANLDIPNTNLRDTLLRYGLDVWTAGQSGSNNTLGRVRVETEPVHRLVVESYDEQGAIELQYVMVDSSTSAVGADVAHARTLRATLSGRTLRLELPQRAGSRRLVELFDAAGRLVLARSLDDGETSMTLPQTLGPGPYVGCVEDCGAFTVVIAD
jgi:phosphodiesterase/alkaline phosphatase D-like protein